MVSYPHVGIPSSQLTDEAATKLAKLRRELPEVKEPVLYMDINNFVPAWITESARQGATAAEVKVRVHHPLVCVLR